MTNEAYKMARNFIGTREIVGRRHNPVGRSLVQRCRT